MSWEAVAVIAGALVNVLGIGAALYQLGRATGKFELIGKQQAREIGELKEAVQTMQALVTQVALHTQNQKAMEDRVGRTERLLEDLRRGEGFIMPLPYARPA